MEVNSGSCPHCATELFLSQCGVCRGIEFTDNNEGMPQPPCTTCGGNGWIVSLTPLGE